MMFDQFLVKALKTVLALFLIFLFLIFFQQSLSAQTADTDNDGISDSQELNVYYTNSVFADTDNDGYADKLELDNGYSPHRPEYKLSQLDWDKDGLSDAMEINLGTDLKNSDTDGDGYFDKAEVYAGFDPLNKQPVRLAKKIEINLATQELTYFLGQRKIETYKVSSGALGWETPKGNFKIEIKTPLAWSKAAGLWMPYWMAFAPSGKLGIHELPYWPNGYREGQAHLGKPVSHGCVRLGIGPAKELYDWAEIGTPVVIK